jgi:rubrerythrin
MIDLFTENELKVSLLYKLYSQKIPAQKKFWSRLSEEEIKHAAYIRECCGNLKPEFAENNFTRDAVSYVVNFVKDEIKSVRKKNISHLAAINTALRVEQSILEKKYFDFFNPQNKDLEKMMRKLNKETRKHVRMLQKEMEKSND